jgi:hypothetical protein
METAPEKYDVDWETNFNRAKLTTAIPNRLQESQDAITSRQGDINGDRRWTLGLALTIEHCVAFCSPNCGEISLRSDEG